VQGRAAALEAAQQVLEEKVSRQLTTLVSALREAIDCIHAARAGWLAHWEKTAIQVAAAMAARVIRRELTSQPEITLTLVKEALELAAGSGEIQLRLHPADFKALGAQVEQLIAELSRLGTARIVADPQITAGGCRVDTRYGVIDQQFESQLARIEQELT
jgi:flagellar assembly protein FliH